MPSGGPPSPRPIFRLPHKCLFGGWIEISHPDVVVSDVVMPGRSGLELARELRARPTNTMSMVAVSGFTQPDEVESALDAGFDIHVAKPVDSEDLVRAVQDAARLRVH